jgi:hypothetical protein
MMLHRSVHPPLTPGSKSAFRACGQSYLLADEYDEICWNALNKRRLNLPVDFWSRAAW